MYVPYIKPMEGDLVGVVVCGFGVTCLAIFLGLCELGDDGDAYKFLACKLNSLSNRFFLSELNVANAVRR